MGRRERLPVPEREGLGDEESVRVYDADPLRDAVRATDPVSDGEPVVDRDSECGDTVGEAVPLPERERLWV